MLRHLGFRCKRGPKEPVAGEEQERKENRMETELTAVRSCENHGDRAAWVNPFPEYLRKAVSRRGGRYINRESGGSMSCLSPWKVQRRLFGKERWRSQQGSGVRVCAVAEGFQNQEEGNQFIREGTWGGGSKLTQGQTPGFKPRSLGLLLWTGLAGVYRARTGLQTRETY